MKQVRIIFFSLFLSLPVLMAAPPPSPDLQKALDSVSEEEALTFVKSERPDQMDSLLAMKKNEPENYARKLQLTKMLFLRDRRMKEENPELHRKIEDQRRSRLELRQSVEAYKKESDPAKKEDLKKQIRTLLDQEFNASLETQKNRLQEAKKRLAEQEKKIQDQESGKARVMEERLTLLLKPGLPKTPVSPAKPADSPEKSKSAT